MFPRKKKSAWLRKAKMGFWLFLTYNTASSKWIRTATKFTLVVQNSSFLCHAEYCRWIEKKEVESLNHLRCRIRPLKGSFFFSNSVLKTYWVGNRNWFESLYLTVRFHILWGFLIKLLETVTLLITDLNLSVGVAVCMLSNGYFNWQSWPNFF